MSLAVFIVCVLYQALAWRVLKTSQQFYHDDFESRQGILSALMLAPIVAGVGCVPPVLLSRENQLASGQPFEGMS